MSLRGETTREEEFVFIIAGVVVIPTRMSSIITCIYDVTSRDYLIRIMVQDTYGVKHYNKMAYFYW